jgi:hypothetical protein
MEPNARTIILHNSSELDILDYPIEEAIIDPNTGDTILDSQTQTYKKTGVTLKWSIKTGETVQFPYYVGQYLKSIYGFLKDVNPKKFKPTQTVAEDKEPAKDEDESSEYRQ